MECFFKMLNEDRFRRKHLDSYGNIVRYTHNHVARMEVSYEDLISLPELPEVEEPKHIDSYGNIVRHKHTHVARMEVSYEDLISPSELLELPELPEVEEPKHPNKEITKPPLV